MEWFISGPVEVWVFHFFLLVTRMSALFIVSPIFGRSQLPAIAKIMLSVVMAFIAIEFYPPVADALPPTIPHFAVMVAGELITGLVIGYVTTLFFSVVFTAGYFIDTQIGFGMVQVFDPVSNAQMPIAGSLFNLVLIECFLLTDGHLKLITVLFKTLDVIPVGEIRLSRELAQLMVEGFAKTFSIGFSIAAPILASALVAEIALGILVRTAPQMNIFVVGMPLKTLLGLVMLIALVPVFVYFTGNIFDDMFLFMEETIYRLAPA